MYFATIDCGTTNSRVYVLDEGLRIVHKGTRKVGVRDTAITGSREALREGLAAVFATVTDEAGLRVEDIRFAITSGMITSEIGLQEIPHLWAPAGLAELAESLTVTQDRSVFPLDLPLVFIRGVKNPYPPETTYEDIRRIDFMRGEETQIMGLLTRSDMPRPPLTAIVLSSHTKYIHVRDDGRIAGSLTTLSGQVFEAIRQATSIGKSIAAEGEPDVRDLPLAIETAYEAVRHAGFLRALLMPRFMEVLLKVPAEIRRAFVEAAIAAEDLRVLQEFPLLGFPLDCPMVLIGSPSRCHVFRELLARAGAAGPVVAAISAEEAVDRLSIDGAVAIARRAGWLTGGTHAV
jgi:2-dehydro-3-deoxygalactonokinase